MKAKAVNSVTWTGGATAAVVILQAFQLVVLARVLQPEDFGLMAIVVLVVSFTQFFLDAGLGNAIIYRQQMSRRELSSVYWLNLLIGLLLFMMVWLFAPLVAVFFHEPRLTLLLRLAATVFAFLPLGQQFQYILQRDLNFPQLSKIEVTSSIAGTAFAVASALLGAGVFALIWGLLSSSAVKTALLALTGWRKYCPMAHFALEDIRPIWSFGAYQMGERLLNHISSNIDYILIGRFMGPEVLGIYSFAYQLILLPIQRINPIINRVAFPIFAMKSGDNHSLSVGYGEVIRILAIILCPIFAGMAAVAPVAVPAVFGSEWGAAVPLLQILTIVGVTRGLTNPSGSLLLAKGRADIGFAWNVATLFILGTVLAGALPFGIRALALAFAAVSFLSFFAMLWVLGQLVGLKPTAVLKGVQRPLIISLAMGAVVSAVALALYDVLSPLRLLIVLAVLGITLYAVPVLLLERRYLREIWRLLRKKAEVVP